MKKTIKIIILLMIIISINAILPNCGERWSFNAEDLPSNIVTTNIKRVDYTKESGYLIYGPYINLSSGKYRIAIEYNTDSKDNLLDVVSTNEEKVFYKDTLDDLNSRYSFTVDLEKEISDLEIRVLYNGNSFLEVNNIKIARVDIGYKLYLNIALIGLLLSYWFTGKKIRFNSKYLLIPLFIGIIYIPMLFGLIQRLTGTKLDIKLKGNFDTYTMPRFELKEFANGDFQNKFEINLNNTFAPRGVVIKSYNQVRYSLFSEGNRIIGKNGSVFEIGYINDYLTLNSDYDFNLESNKEKMNAYVNDLEELSKKLSKVGKNLIVYTTPSKAVFQSDNIPFKYTVQDTSRIRAVDYFREKINGTSVIYLDSTKILENNTAYPIFYNTAIHWSRPAEQEISKSLIDIINTQLGLNTKNIILGELESNKDGYWRDKDVYDLLNVFYGKSEDEYYQYKVKLYVPESYVEPNILLQGGSFGEGFKKDYLENGIGSNFTNIFYNRSLWDSNGDYVPIQSWEDLDVKNLISQTDLVIIEVNEEHLFNCSNGFVNYLNNYMESHESLDAKTTY